MIKIGRNRKVKYSGIKKEVMAELSTIISELRKDITKEEIEMCVKIGLEAYEKFRKPKIETYEISANSIEQAIKQVKQLELPKHVEKVVIEQLLKN